MERVMGIGGVFFKAANPAAIGQWYRDNPGVPIEEQWGGAVFPWKPNDPEGDAHTVEPLPGRHELLQTERQRFHGELPGPGSRRDAVSAAQQRLRSR